ncbi:DUF6059 family protein [Streptomyces sp. NPDC048297]|uniref:DUF6059 family protein n=1 Tax=Streptomyces sp. NPDC048297 TaxID=3365531 RepID=UPI00371339D7
MLRALYRGLVAAGRMYVWLPESHEGRELTGPPAGPPAWHPERLRPDVPLTRTERALDRQLTGQD